MPPSVEPVNFWVFVSSPGDVAAERDAAFRALDDVRDDPFIASRFNVRVVAWDHGVVGPPIAATVPPQQTLDTQMHRPRDCDIVVLILSGRMGTPLPPEYGRKPDGSPFASGTEWEFHDALAGWEKRGKPVILVYRRWPLPAVPDGAADRAERLEQRAKLEAFFAGFRNPDGSLRRGYVEYAGPAAFEGRLKADLRKVIAAALPPPRAEKRRRSRLLLVALVLGAVGAALAGARWGRGWLRPAEKQAAPQPPTYFVVPAEEIPPPPELQDGN